MKQLLFLLSLLFNYTLFGQITIGDSLIIKEKLYRNGNVKQRISFNTLGQKEGKCFYYNKEGVLDSMITYNKNKRNGLTQLYIFEGVTRIFEYANDKLTSEITIGTNNDTLFIAPLTLQMIGELEIKLLSGKEYFDHNKIDTVRIIGNIPIINRIVSIYGASLRRVDDHLYEVRISNTNNDLQDIKITVTVYGNLIEADRPVLSKIFKIPVK